MHGHHLQLLLLCLSISIGLLRFSENVGNHLSMVFQVYKYFFSHNIYIMKKIYLLKRTLLFIIEVY